MVIIVCVLYIFYTGSKCDTCTKPHLMDVKLDVVTGMDKVDSRGLFGSEEDFSEGLVRLFSELSQVVPSCYYLESVMAGGHKVWWTVVAR